MDILAKQVNDLLKNNYDLNFGYNEGESEFGFSIELDHVCLDVKIFCYEEDRRIAFIGWAPVKVSKSLFGDVCRFINRVHMRNSYVPACLILNEDIRQLASKVILDIGKDFRVDKDVFHEAFASFLYLLDDHFVELMRVLSSENEQNSESDAINNITELIARSEKGDAEAQYQLAIHCYNGDEMEQDFERAFELFELSLANGKDGVDKVLKECLADLQKRMERASDLQDFETASLFQALISKCGDLIRKVMLA